MLKITKKRYTTSKEKQKREKKQDIKTLKNFFN